MRAFGVMLLILASSCEDTEGACPDAADTALTAQLALLPSATGGSVAVVGQLVRPTSVTVNQLLVNGIFATSTSGNYDHFSATVPLTMLTARRNPMTHLIAIDVVAETNCAASGLAVVTDPSVTQVKIPPTIDPAMLTLLAGASIPVTVTFYGTTLSASDAAKRACFARGDSDVTVRAGVQDLSQMPVSATSAGVLAFAVTAVGAARKGAAVQVVCSDENGNEGIATYTVPD